MILEVENLSFAYQPDRPLFQEVNFSFDKGQALSILGANGAGKSTLLNCIANLLTPKTGEARLRDLYQVDLHLTYVEQVDREVCVPENLKTVDKRTSLMETIDVLENGVPLFFTFMRVDRMCLSISCLSYFFRFGILAVLIACVFSHYPL